MHTVTDVIAFAKASAATAWDQWDAFDDSEAAHLVNLIDTMYEHKKTLAKVQGKSFETLIKIAISEYNERLGKLSEC